MRRRDFTIGLLLAASTQPVRAQEHPKQHRIAIVIPSGPVASIDDPEQRIFRGFWDELRRLGDVEGQNLIVERYSGEGRPEGFADLTREVVHHSPEVIVAVTEPIVQAIRAASGTIPIVGVMGDPIAGGLATSLARPGGNVTGVSVFVGREIWGKRLQILKEAVPSTSKVAFVEIRTDSRDNERQLREAGRRLEISMIDVLLKESTPSEYRRVFAEIAQQGPEAIVVSSDGTLVPYRQLIVELVAQSRLPAIYAWRDYVEAGGLMAYEVDASELGRRIADDVREILNGTNPGDVPIYQPTKFQFLINLRAAKALGLTIPPAVLALADEVIE
jgi:putative tryptophan/tyrosine transport system substrate-binding protein